MFKNYLKGIEGIADYPIVSLLVFFVFFCAMMIWWWRADKKHLHQLSELPFRNTEPGNSKQTLN